MLTGAGASLVSPNLHDPSHAAPTGAGILAVPMPVLRILVVDDDPPVREACAEIASGLGLVVETADSVPSARTALAGHSMDIVLLDLKLPGGGGLSLLNEIRSRHPAAEIVVMTAFATVTSAVEAIRFGAGDYLTKPFTLEELTATLERAAQRRSFDAEARQLRERLRTGRGMGDLVGRSPAMEKLYRILSKVAFARHPVLLFGEPGTGKELVARSIHLNGPTPSTPFLSVDCAALTPQQIERELFGHAEGAWDGAGRDQTGTQPGVLVSAEDGTVFLDEVAELPLDLQGRLLRVLQDKHVLPLGATEPVPISARILAATSRNLTSMVETGRFRKDLFFRLNVVGLRIPALRERREDIPLLTAHLLERLGRERGVSYTLSDETTHLLMEYDWPGNVRELEHAVERASALSSGPVLHLGDFPSQLQDAHMHLEWAESPHLISPAGAAAPAETAVSSALPGQVLPIAEMEKQAILNALHQLKGDKLMAARLLGIGKTTLYRKLKEYGIQVDEL